MSNFKRVVNVVPLTAVNLGNSQIFTYLVPLPLQGEVRPGQLVEVEFGRKVIRAITTTFELHRLPRETNGFKELKNIAEANPVMSEKMLALANWISSYYVTPLGVVMRAMLPFSAKKALAAETTGFEKFNPDFFLTEEQRAAVSAISSAFGSSRSFLLHGITGSGKTEVYMRVLERVLESGKQAIMLVPEIGLSAQAIERFARRFGMEQIAIMHSALKDSERLWMWQKINDGEKRIIIGPRSALFAPVQNLGLIVLDEEHDSSYKQYDQNPKYHAREVAEKLSELWQCPVVFGDATPSLEIYQRAQGENPSTTLLTLPNRVMADVGLPQVEVIDMRREIEAGNFSTFSDKLAREIKQNLSRGRQIILFLNRRGSATFVMCRDCGFVASCRDCAVPLVYHLSQKALICHHCGKNYPIPTLCPNCSRGRIKYFGIGTEGIEEELQKLLGASDAVIARMDRDTTRKRGSHGKIYSDWSAGKIQILIGTQMIGKGWDVSGVGLVGVISADTTLHLPDFRASERTFQMLTQVAGRAGRGKDRGLAIFQTYNPENFAIEAAREHNYAAFYEYEIAQRREHNYPPFARLAKVTVKNSDAQKALAHAGEVADKIRSQQIPLLEVSGPVPAFITKVRGMYRYQIILRAPQQAAMDWYKILQDISAIDIDIDPDSLL